MSSDIEALRFAPALTFSTGDRFSQWIAIMLKLLLCLLSATAISVVLLQLRQQRLELNYQANRWHTDIEKTQSKLWNQQLQIAMFTAPNAIAKTVGDQDLKMVPQAPIPAMKTNWIDPAEDPHAE